ncbi:MAG: T9SS type A sorting domain-containing protein [Bacteroidia bacterium]
MKHKRTEVDVNYFAQGVYVVSIKLNNNIAYKKFIKQ